MAIKHYSGRLGEFDYDTTEFEVRKYLFYIGKETDGSKIHIPDGLVDADCLFSSNEQLVSSPVFPDSVRSCNDTFRGCKALKIPPVLSSNIISCSDMLVDCVSLESVPVVPKSVDDCSNMFGGCRPNISQIGAWHMSHRGVSMDEICNDYYSFEVIQSLDFERKCIAATAAFKYKESDGSPAYKHVMKYVESGNEYSNQQLLEELLAADKYYSRRKYLPKREKSINRPLGNEQIVSDTEKQSNVEIGLK